MTTMTTMTTFFSTHAFLFAQFAIGLFWVIGMRLSAMSTDDLEATLVDAFADAMHRAHMTFKEMAYAMGIDEAQLRRQLAREHGQHLSLYRLIRAPFAWWCYFGPSLMLVVWQRRYAELREEAEALHAMAVRDVKSLGSEKRSA